MPPTRRARPPRRAGPSQDWHKVAVLGAVFVLSDLALVGILAHQVPSTSIAARGDLGHPSPEHGWQEAPPSRETPRPPVDATPPSAADLDASLAEGMRSLGAAVGLPVEGLIPEEGRRQRARDAGGLDTLEAQALLQAYRAETERVAAELKGSHQERRKGP